MPPQTAAGHRSTHRYQVCTCHICSSGSLLPELLGKPDEYSFGAPDVAEPIRIFVLDHFADEFCAAFPEPGERIVDVPHGEHDAQVTESVYRGAAVIGDHRRREESGDLDPAVTVWRTHHGNLYAHVAQSSDAICPVPFDWGAPLELETKFGEELSLMKTQRPPLLPFRAALTSASSSANDRYRER
jgi:hypothetical protein